jgi:hypothetical protein
MGVRMMSVQKGSDDKSDMIVQCSDMELEVSVYALLLQMTASLWMIMECTCNISDAGIKKYETTNNKVIKN